MATFSLRRFSCPEILKAIAVEKLLAFLEPYRLFFLSRGVTLPQFSSAENLDYEELAKVFMTPDTKTPKELIDALYFVDEMATPEGMDALLAEAERHQLKLAPGSDHSPADIAVQIWLLNKDILERKHAEHYLAKVRSFESYQMDRSKKATFKRPSAKQLEKMADDLDGWFERKKRGRGAKIIMCDRPDGVWFLVRHGEPFKREESLEGGNSAVDPNLLVTPSINPSATSMTVTVPQFAATGPLLVHIPDQYNKQSPLTFTDVQSPQTFTVNNYRNTYGFSFPNSGPSFEFNITEGLIDDEYGSPYSAGDVIIGGILGGGIGAAAVVAEETAWALAYLKFCQSELNGLGSCYGFALASVVLAENQSQINAANGLPANSAPTPTVFNLQNNANLTLMIQKDLLVQFSAEEANYAAGWAHDSVLGNHSAQGVRDQILSLLQSGQHPIIGITHGADHAVVAYGLEPDPNNSADYYIDVYDPDRPYNNNDGEQELFSRIHIDPVSGWSFTLQKDGSVHTGGFNDLSFMVTPSSVVSGQVSKPSTTTVLTMLGNFVFNAAAKETSASPGSQPQETVAHELAHLILNKHHKHLNTKQPQSALAGRRVPQPNSSGAVERDADPTPSRLVPHSRGLERAVDRIAAELLMPEALVIPLLRDSGVCAGVVWQLA